MPESVAVATWRFGEPAVRKSLELLEQGASALDAVEAGINVTEMDTTVTSVGYGGYPNSDGELEVDAAIMDGPGHRAGSVGAVKGIRRPISLARLVMEQCPHVMLVGDGAQRFARAAGMEIEPTDTEESRNGYANWLARGRPRRWLGGAAPADIPSSGPESRSHDTIGLAALDRDGRLAVGCSTSGLAFKHPGRVGDSPIIGAGLYVDQKCGAATATGVGELILRFSMSHLAVEGMRRGLSPQEACEEAILRMVEVDARYAALQVGVIALSLDGEVGAASSRPQQNALMYAVARPGRVDVFEAHIPIS